MAMDRYQIEGFADHYDQSVVSVNGKPHYVYGGIDRRAKVFTAYPLTENGLGLAVQSSMDDVSSYDLASGFYQVGGNAFLVSRSPERTTRRGMCGQNMIVSLVEEAGVPLKVSTLNLDYTRWAAIIKSELAPPKYRSADWEKVNKTIREGHNASMAISNQFAIVRRVGKEGYYSTLVTAGGPVGRVTPKMEIVIHPKLKYLKDNLDACIATSFTKGEEPHVAVG